MMLMRTLFCLSLAGTVGAQAATTLFVSPQGADTNPGTAARPFATLAKARDAVRALKRGGLPEGGVAVQLEPGTYVLSEPFVLTAADAGTAAAPIVYRASQRGTAILSGGVTLANWQPVTDPALLRLLSPDAQGKVVVAEIPADLFAAIPGFANGGCGYKGKPEYPVALYQGDARLPISRWPNEGYVKTGECLGKSEDWGRGIKFTEGIFRFADPRLARWVGEPDLWFDGLWYWPWADQKMQCQTIDPTAKTIALANPESHAFGFQKDQEFFAFNAIGEIDRPGEWAVDRAARRVYLWPAADPATAPVSLAVQDHLIAVTDCAHLRFEDLVLEHTVGVVATVTNSSNVSFTGSVLRHTGSWGVVIDGGHDCSVIGCDLYDLGEGGVKATGGERKTLTPGNHLIENNHIHHFGQFVATYRPGTAVYGVGNRIRHNLIHHAQHQAIFFNGNDHLIEYNIVHDVCLHTSDAGAIYACTRDWSQRGTVIRSNLIHTTGKGVDACGSHGIYMDDSTSGTTIERNIIIDVGVGITSCGLDNRVENNLAVNTLMPAFQISSRGIDSFAKVNAAKGRESSLFRLFLRDEALFRTDLWRQRYPNLLAVLDLDPIGAHDSHFNVLRNNANVGGVPASVHNAEKIGRTSTIENNVNLYEDPGFVDLAGADLRLRPDGRVFQKLSGFQAPDFVNMGLYADARRASPAVKFGEGVSAMPVIQPRIPRPELKPRYILEELTGKPLAADGVGAPEEWPKTGKALLECANPIYKAPSKLATQARIGYDGTRLRFLVTVNVEAGKPLKTDGKWGGRDGFEMAFSDTGEDAPVFLFHAYPDGTWELVPAGASGTEQCQALREALVYGAHSEDGVWTAELALPVAPLGIDPATFSELRFNLNVHRTCDSTWTCWWTPENGIPDLLSSGLLIMPREIPETAEMARRREAAQPLFAAEAKGELAWQLLKDWKLTADPDQVGPAAQPADAPAVSFSSYGGWAVARATVTLTAEQAAAPFRAVFFPCIDEEGDVYLDGKLAVSHTAQATGFAPGLLWRQPVLVELGPKAAAGPLAIAVHLRGNMGTGGLHKGAFLVWGQTKPTAEQLYDFLAANPKLDWRDRVPAFWQDFARERIPALPAVADEATFGTRIQRTMNLLATSSPERRNGLRILFYGQSIVQGMHCREMINTLRSHFPWAIIDFENRAIGGFGASSLVRTAIHDLYPRDPDLVIFHVYGGETDGTLEAIMAGMRQRTSSDILVFTHHYTWTANPEGLASGLKSRDESTVYWLELAEKYQLEVAPVRRDWPLFFRQYDWGINEVMGDTVHSNVHHNPAGHTLLAQLVLRNFRYHPDNPVTFPAAVRQLDPTGDAVTTGGIWQRDKGVLRTTEAGATLRLPFVGNRVDAMLGASAKAGTVTVTVDGKAPSEWPELYVCTRPSEGPYIWMPAIKQVGLGEGILPRAERWTLTPYDVDIAKNALSYRLEGSVTGPDGTGSQAADFVSTSGRIKLEAKDFHIVWPCTYRKKDQLPEGYTVTWEVLPLCADICRFPALTDPAAQRPVTLVQGLPNGSHTLEITTQGEVAIQGLVVRRPPLE